MQDLRCTVNYKSLYMSLRFSIFLQSACAGIEKDTVFRKKRIGHCLCEYTASQMFVYFAKPVNLSLSLKWKLSNTDSEVIVLKGFNLIQFYLEMKWVLKAHPVV